MAFSDDDDDDEIRGEVIDLSSEEEQEKSEDEAPQIDYRELYEPIVRKVVDALGGQEGGEYRLGDEVAGCLKDLKKLWRKDDTDDDRTIARIFWETHVLPNDLIPILLGTAGKGRVEDKRAIYCVDLITAMTWPIDMAEELKELDEEMDKSTDYTQLLGSHIHYKSALLKPGVLQALFGIILPPLTKPPRERVERDGQIINVVLHLIRNLAFIKDLASSMHISADQVELSNLQSKLIRGLSETHFIELLLTIASNDANDPLFTTWNTVILEIFYLLFRGVTPTALSADQVKQPTETLNRLLAAEEATRRDLSRKSTTRHSRFGTTIAVRANPNKKPKVIKTEDGPVEADSDPQAAQTFILHRQQAINREAGSIMDMTKKQKPKRATVANNLGRTDNLSLEAKLILQNLAGEFLASCFNRFLALLLKDIKSERAKITEKDHLRLLYVTQWFLEFFLAMRAKTKDSPAIKNWGFGVVAEVTEQGWIVWVLKRMREATEDKPKLWTELQAGIECLTQLLLLIESMSAIELNDEKLSEAAQVLQQQLIYNGEVLDIALESLRNYKPGTQALAYLDASVHLAYALLRMLEKWSKGGDVYVRRKKKRRRARRKVNEDEDGGPEFEEDDPSDAEDDVAEISFTFDAFEMKFANSEIAHVLLTYLGRYREFDSVENMRRVVSLLHRQAVKAKAEGLFFQVSTLNTFKSILADQKGFPNDRPYKDLVNLINFILRKFFKALEEESFLAVEAFFPMNRGHWKAHSSWQPEEKEKKSRGRQAAEDTRPQEVQVKKGYTWTEQVGIVVAALVDADQTEFVEWTKDILTVVIAQRKRILDEIKAAARGNKDDNDDALDEDAQAAKDILDLQGFSSAASAQMTDYMIPYLSDEQATAATKNAQLKLLFRLSKFFAVDENADEIEWYVPAGIAPTDLQSALNVIAQFLETPLDLAGKKASQLLGKKTRRRRRRETLDSEPEEELDDDGEPREKREKKKKEKVEYKSAQFIEDSDDDEGAMAAFLEKEKTLRERLNKAAIEQGEGRSGAMRATGTKKRRRKEGDGTSKSKKAKKQKTTSIQPGTQQQTSHVAIEVDSGDESDVEVVDVRRSSPGDVPQPPKPRPKPKPIKKLRPVEASDNEISDSEPVPSRRLSKKTTVVISDDDE